MGGTVSVPRIRAYGDGSCELTPLGFPGGEVGTDIEGLDTLKPISKLAQRSGSLRDQGILYEIGLRQELSRRLDLPPEVLKAGKIVYDLFHVPSRGNATDDACDYDNGDKTLRKPNGKYSSVRWIVHPRRFRDGKAVIGPSSEVYHIVIPPIGWVRMTMDGLYRPDTGTPFETADNWEDAVQSLTKAGFPPELARNEAAFFLSGKEGAGTHLVLRWYLRHYGGPFSIYALVGGPGGGGDPDIGSFLVRRSPGGTKRQ